MTLALALDFLGPAFRARPRAALWPACSRGGRSLFRLLLLRAFEAVWPVDGVRGIITVQPDQMWNVRTKPAWTDVTSLLSSSSDVPVF